MSFLPNHRRPILLICILISLLASISVDGQPEKSIKGVYALNPRDEPIPDQILAVSNVTGISLRASWKKLAPVPGKFDWSYLDSEIARAEGAGKTITLRLMAGIHAPDWLYTQGAKAFEFTDKNPLHTEERRGARATFGKKLRIPIPWDEIFLKEWKAFIAAVGERYARRPSIAILHVTGPNRLSAEMTLPKAPEDRQRWKAAGYTPQKLLQTWQQSIDAWAQTFPISYLSLNLSPVIFDDGVMEGVASYGYEKYGRRFLLQNNALTSDFNQRRKDFLLIRDYASKTTVGFQMLAMATSKLDARQGDLKKSVDHGLLLGASFFEIYHLDILRQPEIISYAVEIFEKH